MISQQKILLAPSSTGNVSACSQAFKNSRQEKSLEKCCQQLYRGDQKAISDASTIHIPPNDDEPMHRLDTCDKFFEHYPTYMDRMQNAPDDENGDFSIAYSILAHRDLQHIERLLRLIYRPQHFYCIHADKKSVGLEKKLRRLVRCLPNVLVASRSHTVVWGGNGILRATLACLKDLVVHKKWSYFINLSAQDMPLKTNAQLTQILISWRNKSNVEITGEATPKKVKYHYEVKYNRFGNADSVYRTAKIKASPPYNVTLMKGNLAVALARPLAEWFVTSPKAAKLFAYLADTANPDEYFWQTALSNRREFDLDDKIAGLVDPYYVRYSIWKGDQQKRCKGKFIRDVCVFGAGDVHRLSNIQKYLFANKLYLGYQSAAYECMSLRHLMKSELDDKL